MKKKVIFLSLALMLLLTGVVSAASLWGKYKGYSIMQITVDGVPVKTDVPAFVFDNRTMVPVYMLKEAGIKYTLNGNTQTVDIQNEVSSIKDLMRAMDYYKLLESLGAEFKNFTSSLSYGYYGVINNNNSDSIDSAYTYLNILIEKYNKYLDYYDSLTDSFVGTDLSISASMITIDKYFNVIEYYKKSLAGLDKYYTSKSISDFNTYLNNSKSGYALSVEGESLSRINYESYRTLILNK